MKEIQLTQGMVALVDDKDFEYLSQWKWFYTRAKNEHTGYARKKLRCPNTGKRINHSMHTLLMGPGKDQCVDHIDGNGINNQRSNLRVCSARENAWNRRRMTTKKLKANKGVTIIKNRKGTPSYWIARIGVHGERLYLGTFKTKELAEMAYAEAAHKYHKHFARVG